MRVMSPQPLSSVETDTPLLDHPVSKETHHVKKVTISFLIECINCISPSYSIASFTTLILFFFVIVELHLYTYYECYKPYMMI